LRRLKPYCYANLKKAGKLSNKVLREIIIVMSIKRTPFHPLFFGVYSILALLGYNIGEISIRSAARSFVFVFLLSIIILLIGRVLLKDWQRAGFVSSVLLIVFFSYGHIYSYLEQFEGLGILVGRHRVLIPLSFIPISFAIWWVTKNVQDWDNLTPKLNLIAFVLLILPVFQITSFIFRSQYETKIAIDGNDISLNQLSPVTGEKPDIYYIVADSYTRQDVLLKRYKYDNMPFIEDLRVLGFYVTECGQSNYSKTAFSLASTLNLNYVDTFGDDDFFYLDQEGRPNQVKFGYIIRHNKVRSFLDANGYKTVAFETGFEWLDWTDADLFLHRNFDRPLSLRESILLGPINEFEALLVSTSLGLAFADFGIIFGLDALLSIDNDNSHHLLDAGTGGLRQKYDRANYQLDTLDDIVELDGPKFVFVHLYPPHALYVFAPDGQFSTEALRDESGYPREIAFLNDRFLKIFETIITTSERPAIIILQGDHGSAESTGETERIYILNAIYLPDGRMDLLYPTITPVNTFRLIFDHYFGSDLGLVEDISYNHLPYISEVGTLIEFEIIPNKCE
jgi:hypothetical protein